MGNPYDWAHQQERSEWQAEIDARPVRCHCRGSCGKHAGRCRVTIRHGMTWHLGHKRAVAQGGADGPKAPWCELCNLRDGVRVREALRRAPRSSQDWG